MRKNRGFKQCCLYMEMKTTAIDFHFELTERLSYCTYCTVQKNLLHEVHKVLYKRVGNVNLINTAIRGH